MQSIFITITSRVPKFFNLQRLIPLPVNTILRALSLAFFVLAKFVSVLQIDCALFYKKDLKL